MLVARPTENTSATADTQTPDPDRVPEDDPDGDAPPTRGLLTVLDPTSGVGAPLSLFDQEEHPERLVLTVMAREDADEFVGALEAEGVGGKVGDATEDDGVEILIHEPNVAVAQAVLVDFTGDPTLTDYIEPEGGHDDGAVEVARLSILDAPNHVERLLKAGIDVTLRPPPPDTPPKLAAAVVFVSEDDAGMARNILGIAR